MAEEQPTLLNSFYDLLKEACERASENAVKALYEWSLGSSEREAQVPPRRATKPERGAQYVPQDARKNLLAREVWPRLKKLPPEAEVASLRRIFLDVLGNDKNMRNLKAAWNEGVEALKARQQAVLGRSVPARQSPKLPEGDALPSTQLSSTSSLTTLPSSQPQPCDTQGNDPLAQLYEQIIQPDEHLPADTPPQLGPPSAVEQAPPPSRAAPGGDVASPAPVPASVDGDSRALSGGAMASPAPAPASIEGDPGPAS
ncbi:hypothetical protein K525DRAFT_266491, partial [Schizophyllum commune Loenen D]